MNPAALLVVLLNFALIGALPIVFFRRDGRLNLMWWLTGLPFFLCPLFLITIQFAARSASQAWNGSASTLQDLLAVPFSLVSIALIALTLGTHRVPIALWYQNNDAPRNIVTFGAYAWVRHPFYLSFLMAFSAACILLPHPLVLGFAAYVAIVLALTAMREEKRLLASEFGAEYRDYMHKTGRFLPRWRVRVHV
jgi:protein-S-isoprenylcysteine O-methyltransferase Ste14